MTNIELMRSRHDRSVSQSNGAIKMEEERVEIMGYPCDTTMPRPALLHPPTPMQILDKDTSFMATILRHVSKLNSPLKPENHIQVQCGKHNRDSGDA